MAGSGSGHGVYSCGKAASLPQLPCESNVAGDRARSAPAQGFSPSARWIRRRRCVERLETLQALRVALGAQRHETGEVDPGRQALQVMLHECSGGRLFLQAPLAQIDEKRAGQWLVVRLADGFERRVDRPLPLSMASSFSSSQCR